MKPREISCCKRILGCSAILLLSVSLPAAASEISGSVINKTKERPAAGDDVILLSLSEGMQEAARTKTDVQGRFRLPVQDEGVQHLIRVVHQGVNYHKPAPQGTSSVDIEVFDVAQRVEKIFGEGHVFRFQATNGQLEVSETYILRNESTPPRTRMSDRSFEITVPEGAEIESGMAAGPGGMPVTSAPVPTGQKNHYAFIFPIRPGRTQFQITYHLPYSGNHSFDVTADMPYAELGVMLPKSMQFKPTGDSFQPATDESGMSTYVAKSLSQGQHLAFSVSGEGAAPAEAQNGTSAMPSGNPGGGLGVPVQGDSPMGSSTWYVLGGLVVALVAGGYYVAHRAPNHGKMPISGVSAAAAVAATRETTRTQARPMQKLESKNRSDSVLELLKEELFQIETEHLNGALSEEQYKEIRAAINALMRRHVGNQS